MNKLAAAAARVIKGSGVRSRSMCSGARSNNHLNSVKETKPGLPETVSPELAAMLQAAREEGIQQERARLSPTVAKIVAMSQQPLSVEEDTGIGSRHFYVPPLFVVGVVYLLDFILPDLPDEAEKSVS